MFIHVFVKITVFANFSILGHFLLALVKISLVMIITMTLRVLQRKLPVFRTMLSECQILLYCLHNSYSTQLINRLFIQVTTVMFSCLYDYFCCFKFIIFNCLLSLTYFDFCCCNCNTIQFDFQHFFAALKYNGHLLRCYNFHQLFWILFWEAVQLYHVCACFVTISIK